MRLEEPITIDFSPIVLKNGNTRQKSITFSSFDITIIDNVRHRICSVAIWPFKFRIPLWTKEEYDAIGDYTQEQLENRLKEVLGDDVKSKIEYLMKNPKKDS